MGDQTISEQQGPELEREAPFPLTDVDRWVLSQKDENWHFHDWEDLKEIIGEQMFNLIPSTFACLLSFFFCLNMGSLPWICFKQHVIALKKQFIILNPILYFKAS